MSGPQDPNPSVRRVLPLGGLGNGLNIAAKSMIAAVVIFVLLNVDVAGQLFDALRNWITLSLGWYYLILLTTFLFVALVLACSKWGNLRLGDDEAVPEFSNFAWFAMILSAGVGIGILYFGVSEPLFYFDTEASFGYPNNPHADRAQNNEMTIDRAIDAMRVTFLHWGLHGWCLYATAGLALAYFAFRKKLPLTMRSSLYPLIGERIYGPFGHAVDLLAIFGTVFGVATSLGLGASQIASGLHFLFGFPPELPLTLLVIASISVVATASALSGLHRGMRFLSTFNVYLSIVFVLVFFFVGPTVWLISLYATSLGEYLGHLLPMGLWTASEEDTRAWQSGWTLFYWGWWISWTPFVGMFIARISRGRTIRTYLIGVTLVPTSVVFFWICMLGGNAIWQELNAIAAPAFVGGAGVFESVRAWDLPGALYRTIANLGAASWMGDVGWIQWPVAALATLLLVSWFVTSSDSGTLVITTMLSMGDTDPPAGLRAVWGLSEGLVAAVLLIAGGLGALQSATIAAAFPISIVLILMTAGLLRSLASDPSAVITPATDAAPDGTRFATDLRVRV